MYKNLDKFGKVYTTMCLFILDVVSCSNERRKETKTITII